MIHVEVKTDEPLEKAIRRFKRVVSIEGVITEVKRREYFQKPSAIRHEKNKKLKRKMMKNNKKIQKILKADM